MVKHAGEFWWKCFWRFSQQKKLENLLPNFAGSSPPISPKTSPTSLWKSLVLKDGALCLLTHSCPLFVSTLADSWERVDHALCELACHVRGVQAQSPPSPRWIYINRSFKNRAALSVTLPPLQKLFVNIFPAFCRGILHWKMAGISGEFFMVSVSHETKYENSSKNSPVAPIFIGFERFAQIASNLGFAIFQCPADSQKWGFSSRTLKRFARIVGALSIFSFFPVFLGEFLRLRGAKQSQILCVFGGFSSVFIGNASLFTKILFTIFVHINPPLPNQQNEGFLLNFY